MLVAVRELNFDGLAGPTHNYAGLSPGNLAAEAHAGNVSNPRAAALQSIAKMRFVSSLGIGQAVLPPQPRPDVGTLRRLGFTGSDEEVIRQAAQGDGHLLRLCVSSSAMWTANAATVAPSADTEDHRVHLTPANLTAMFHRSLEPPTTTAVLRAIFADPKRFAVHDALPAGPPFGDEGAANHTRLFVGDRAVHVFAWGRSGFSSGAAPSRFPARQTREASEAVARLHRLPDERVLLWQQAPGGIDAGAFHTDVLAVGAGGFLMLHEAAFIETSRLLDELRRRLGSRFTQVTATEKELPTADAVAAYPFNSQVLDVGDGRLAIVAPRESEDNAAARRFLERVVAEDNPVEAVHTIDVNESMDNGGGPACLRLRVPLTEEEENALGARVLFDDSLATDLETWVKKHYRDRLSMSDLSDPKLLDECRTALDGLTDILRLGSVYDFQRTGGRGE